MLHCRTVRTLLNEGIRSVDSGRGHHPHFEFSYEYSDGLTPHFLRTLTCRVQHTIHPEKKNLIAVFLLAVACLSLWVSGALGTGYDRH